MCGIIVPSAPESRRVVSSVILFGHNVCGCVSNGIMCNIESASLYSQNIDTRTRKSRVPGAVARTKSPREQLRCLCVWLYVTNNLKGMCVLCTILNPNTFSGSLMFMAAEQPTNTGQTPQAIMHIIIIVLSMLTRPKT